MPTLNRSPSTSLPLMAGLASAGHTLGGVPLTVGGAPGQVKVTTVRVLHAPAPLTILGHDSLLHTISPELLSAKPRLTTPRVVTVKGKPALPPVKAAPIRVAIARKATPAVGADVLGFGTLPPLCTDHDLHDALQGKVTSLLGSTGLMADAEKVWQGALDGLKKGAATGAVVATIDIALSQFSFNGIVGLILALVQEIIVAIAHAIGIAVGTSLSIGVAAGSTFGFVGAAIGAIIGACVAVGNLIYGGQHLQIETGDTYSCKDYVNVNIKNAADWLQNNQEKLVGLTALRFSQQAKLFIANPTWTSLNQTKLDKGYPAPPDPNSGDELDLVYQHVPGAFEMLNRAQFLAAVAQVNANPQHLDFYSGIYKPVPGQEVTDRWKKGYDQPPVASAGKNLYGTPKHGAGVYPDPVFTHGWKPFTPMLAPTPGDPYSSASPTTITWGIGLTGAEADAAGLPFNAYSYTACPNLYTNNNTYCTGHDGDGCPGNKHIGTWPDGQGKINGQTDPSPGIYNIQAMYPTLITWQAELLFKKVATAYNVVPVLLPASGGGAPLPPDPTIHPTVPTVVVSGHMASFGPDLTALATSIGDAGTDYQKFLAAHPALAPNVPAYPTVSTLTVVPVVTPPRVRGLSATTSLGVGLLAGLTGALVGVAAIPAVAVGAAGAAIAYSLVGSHVAPTATAKKIAALPQNQAK